MSIENLVRQLAEQGLEPLPAKEIQICSSSVVVKLEYPPDIFSDPLRTIKRKPATFLFTDLVERGDLKSERIIITASSGNFLRELALIAMRNGFKVIGVTPPRIPRENLEILKAIGVSVIHVTEEYDLCPRETTVFFTRALAEKYRLSLVNVDQYSSWQNVLSHIFTTWMEVKRLGDFDYICVPIGSTGTFMGLSLMSRLERCRHKLIGIQPTKHHHIPGVHHVIGDCEWSPEIFSPLVNSDVATVDDVDAYAGLILLWKNGIYGGPSTGMTFAQALKLAKGARGCRILCISADSIFSYRDYVIEILSGLRNKLLERYPSLHDDLNSYLRYLRNLPNIEERVSLIRDIYGLKGEGRVYRLEEIIGNEEVVLWEI